MTLKIALLQLLPGKTLEEQLQLGSAACERAKTLGADIALFPEMWSCGYSIPQDKEKLDSLALTAQSSFPGLKWQSELPFWKKAGTSPLIQLLFLTVWEKK